MTRHLTIDFVSDVACPWCAVGFLALEEALRRTEGVVVADVRCQPFELNPDLGPEGENVDAHLARKGVGTPAQLAAGRAMLRERAAAHGFAFNQSDRSRMWNTFDAHRLLHWAGTTGHQRALKRALFRANFSDDANVSDPEVLAALAAGAGLDAAAARDILASGRYAADVREAERLWIGRGIRGVPGIVIDGKWLISGGQPADVFEEALRRLAAGPEDTARGADRSRTQGLAESTGTWRAQVLPWLNVGPGVHWVRHPGADRGVRDAWVFGVRLEVTQDPTWTPATLR